MGQVNQESNLVNRLVALERKMEEIRKLAGNTSSIISRGGLTLLNDSFLKMVDDAGQLILYAGPNDDGQQIFELRRENGALVLRTLYLLSGAQIWALHDRGGRIVVAEDGESGVGLAEPWIPIPGTRRFFPNAFLDAPGTVATLPASAVPTTSQVWIGQIGKVSHPRIQLRMVQGRVTGVSAVPTYTFRVNGVTLDTWTDATFAEVTRPNLDISSLIGLANVTVELLASATGTGTDRIAADVTGVYLRQS